MKKNKFHCSELIISLILLTLVVFLLNPFYWWMPSKVVMTISVILVLVFSLYSVFVWREQAKDEREALHTMFAGKIAFLAGVATLVLAIIIEAYNHDVDKWLVITLAVMVLAKVFGLIYSNQKH